MITILSSPKPFIGEALKNQVNAIQSWKALDADIEIILYGKAEGAERICRDLKVKHIPDIGASELGTPFFNTIVEHATIQARYDIQMYLNSDILLAKNFLSAIKVVKFQNFLITGRRVDLAAGVFIDTTKKDWMKDVLSLNLNNELTLQRDPGSDYFIFKRGMWVDLPRLVIGRAGYDNALIEYCLKRRIPVVDASFICAVIHQYHEYEHVAEGKKEVFNGPEAMINISAIQLVVSLRDATWQIRNGKLKRSFSGGNILRILEVYLFFAGQIPRMVSFIRFLRTVTYRLGLTFPEPALSKLLEGYEDRGVI